MNKDKIKKINQFFEENDPKIYPYIKTINWTEWIAPDKTEKERFIRLTRSIASQQLAGASARAINERYLNLFPEKTPTPELVLEFTPEELKAQMRTSLSKASYILNIAEAVNSNKLDLKNTHNLNDDEIRNQLVSIKGVGEWTADMFMMFSLGREDLYSFGDYGLKKGIVKVYDLKKDPDKKTIEKLTQKWSPYRTYGSVALWHSLEV